MKTSVGIILLVTCFTLKCVGSRLTPEEQLTRELYPYKDDLRVAIANSLFGKNLNPKPTAGLTCTACRATLLQVIGWVRQGLPAEVIGGRIKTLCTTLNILSPPVCDAIIDKYLDICLTIFNERPWLTRIDICGMILGGGTDRDCRTVNRTMISWDIEINDNKPPNKERPILPDDTPQTKVVHLADVHLDLKYTEGSLAECGDPHCCRVTENDDPDNSSISAGPWGDYRDCDMPLHATEIIFNDISTRHPDAEFIIMTGDLTHHQIWTYNKEDNLAHYKAVFSLFHQNFQKIPIYPVVGNHEPTPCNLFPTRGISESLPKHNISWVYESLANEFSSILPPPALETFRRAGYYSLIHRPGFRIISVNTNFCYTLNFWLIHSPIDPEGQLQWLSNTLYEAEKNNEVVWIIGHVPPGDDDCWFYWGEKYNRLVNRYENIIRAQFFGHTHNDELRIYFDMDAETPRPTGSSYISTSSTSYSFINPGYKVFYADGTSNETKSASWEILDHEAWIYNLTEANVDGRRRNPTLFKEYSAKKMYGVKSFRPNHLYELVERMAKDDITFQNYYKLWQMSYDKAEECTTVKCKYEFLCPIVRTDYSTENCHRLRKLMIQ